MGSLTAIYDYLTRCTTATGSSSSSSTTARTDETGDIADVFAKTHTGVRSCSTTR